LIMTGIEAACDPNRSTCWTFVDPSRPGKVRIATTAR
jgi:hypothetical protein